MKIMYTGRHETLSPEERGKIEKKFEKLAKFLDNAEGDKGARIVVSAEKNQHAVEIELHYYDHALVGKGEDPELFQAVSQAFDKLEKQAKRAREKYRDTKRTPPRPEAIIAEPQADAEVSETPETAPTGGQVFRVDGLDGRKPMTLEEALLEMEDGREYLVYRDAETDAVSFLVRRADGNFDLVEA